LKLLKRSVRLNRQTTDGRTTTYSERERELKFANKNCTTFNPCPRWFVHQFSMTVIKTRLCVDYAHTRLHLLTRRVT